MKEILGEGYKGDSHFAANCRRLQSIYRNEIKEEIRPYKDRKGEIHYYGNYISNGEIPKENCYKNFLTEYAFKYAKHRVAHKEKRETIETDRLFNNLLSSQPMAFNLFCPLKELLEESTATATKIIKSALPHYPIHTITDVDLEFIPANYKNLTGDKSAMDAIIKYQDKECQKGFIAIETKYSENLGTNAAYDKDENGNKKPRAQSLKAVKELKCFTLDAEERITDGRIKLTQIYRNFLLSEMYAHSEGLQSNSIILAPKNHPTTESEIKSLTNELRDEYKDKIKGVILEDFVNSIINNCPNQYRAVFERFYDRYLNFEKLNSVARHPK